jgi:hypothetical protein
MNPEILSRELGEISASLKGLIHQITELSGMMSKIALDANTHCNKITAIEKTCQNRINATKWVVAFALSFAGTIIAYIKL